MSSQNKRRRKRSAKLFWIIGIVGILLAATLIVAMFLLNNGVNVSYRSGDTSSDLPVNTRQAEDFTVEDGFIRYPGAMLGIDVAEFQGEIDWQAVRSAGVEFAILRIGYRGYLHGALFADESFERNYSSARQAGIRLGVYFFSQACTEAEAEEEAAYVLSALNGASLELPVFFDWEESFSENSRTSGKATSEVSAYAKAFCRRITDGGYRAGVYFNQQYGYGIMDLESLGDYAFWLAEYDDVPVFFYDFSVWQYTGSGQVDGIGTQVDLDLYFDG